MDGIIVIYKEKGFTSHDVVAKLRGILRTRKIGHTGTLDPEAEGVLPVCVGKATKLCDLLTDKDKTYEAVMKLGIKTDTQDMTGTIVEEKEMNHSFDVTSSLKEIKEACLSFCGEYNQIPPMYSALKVNGKKLYELAREGKEIERQPRKVYIHELVVKEIDLEAGEVTMEVTCSKGTYIRTLCYDIGEKLGCGACMKSLKRTRVERFSLADSLTLSEVEEKVKEGTVDSYFLQVDSVFKTYPKVTIKEDSCKFLYNGNCFLEKNIEKIERFDSDSNVEKQQLVRVYDYKNTFLALYQYDKKNHQYKPFKMFL